MHGIYHTGGTAGKMCIRDRYVSGHPMEEYLDIWKNNITAKTTDFTVDLETGRAIVADGARVTIGEMCIRDRASPPYFHACGRRGNRPEGHG